MSGRMGTETCIVIEKIGQKNAQKDVIEQQIFCGINQISVRFRSNPWDLVKIMRCKKGRMKGDKKFEDEEGRRMDDERPILRGNK